ncbi:hypothetical protein [uncultured Ilyobacter sp.]|uniref:hypothetical protein n=1 Tax=uncultured Ilyobacter sp. TaxID=544433 RepID=UPI0029C6F832|nr:hypothetical protein [uncultured Ilyobacter sp.]
MEKKKAYSMIELIMAVGSLLLVFGVFSVIVKTYLEEFSEGTLGERKWADIQTFFTYVNRDLENLSSSLESGEILEINSNGTIEIRSSDGTITDFIVYSIDDTTGNIKRGEAVIAKVNKNFEINGLKLRVYENKLKENSINSSWKYENLTDYPVPITSGDKSNYFIETVINLADGSEITGGYALRLDNVIESTDEEDKLLYSVKSEKTENFLEKYYYFYDFYKYYTKDDYYYYDYYYTYNYNDFKNFFDYNYGYNINMDGNSSYSSQADKIIVEVGFETGKYNSVTGISYYDESDSEWVTLSKVSESSLDKSITYESTEKVYVDDNIRLRFTLSNYNGLNSSKDFSVTVDVYDSE